MEDEEEAKKDLKRRFPVPDISLRYKRKNPKTDAALIPEKYKPQFIEKHKRQHVERK